MKWTDLPVHVIDFEGSARTGVVEYGVVTLQGGRIVEVATRLCRNRSSVPPDESRVHGLSDRHLAAVEPFEAEWAAFSRLRERGVLAAHFSATENRLLRDVWPFPRLSPDFLDPSREVAEWGPWIDTGRLASERFGPSEPAGLESVVVRLGLEAELDALAARHCPDGRRCYHCAPFDALASAVVLLRLACDPDASPWSLARLLATSTADPRERQNRSQSRLF